MLNQRPVVESYMAQAGIDGVSEAVSEGNLVETWRIHRSGKDFVLQYNPGLSDILQVGAAGLKQFTDTEVPVPDIVYQDEDILVTEFEGETLENSQFEEDYRAAGETLAKIHEADAPSRHGLFYLEDDGEFNVAGYKNWQKCFRNCHVRKVAGAEKFFSEKESDDISRFYQDNIQYLPLRTEPSYLHGDYSPDNMVGQQGEIDAVIDWDSIQCGDPAFEYFKALETMKRENKPVEKFKEGYNSTGSVKTTERIEKLYRLHANTAFLSAMEYQKNELGIDTSSRNKKYAQDKVMELIENS